MSSSEGALSAQIAGARARVAYATPVPSDIAISQSLTPLPISAVAADAGILPEELQPYGEDKAKVRLSVRDRLALQPDGAWPRVAARARGRRVDAARARSRASTASPYTPIRARFRRVPLSPPQDRWSS